MTRQELVTKLETIFAEAERTHLFGSTEIEWRCGKPTIIREIKTNRLDGENPHNANSKIT
jgi:hypothetical protein